MSETEGVGSRVRAARKLAGYTQRQLADRAHVSLSLVKAVEQERTPASPAFVAAIGRVLGLTPAHLYDADGAGVAPPVNADVAALQGLRIALDAYDEPRPRGRPLALDGIVDRLARVEQQVYRLRYDVAARELPDLLHHLYTLIEEPGDYGERSAAALHDAYRMCATVAGQFRQTDVAAIASERHTSVAPATGDPLRVAISAYHRSSRHLQHGDFRAGLRLLERARQHIASEPDDRAVLIQLDVRCAVLAARAGDGRLADEFLEEARAISAESEPPATPYYNVDASPLNIDVHWCAVPVERYDGAEAVRRNQQVRVEDSRRPERVAHHHMDMARAWLLRGGRDEVLRHLNEARRIAPHNTRAHPQVAETVVTLAERDRRHTESLAGFARWAGIHI